MCRVVVSNDRIFISTCIVGFEIKNRQTQQQADEVEKPEKTERKCDDIQYGRGNKITEKSEKSTKDEQKNHSDGQQHSTTQQIMQCRLKSIFPVELIAHTIQCNLFYRKNNLNDGGAAVKFIIFALTRCAMASPQGSLHSNRPMQENLGRFVREGKLATASRAIPSGFILHFCHGCGCKISTIGSFSIGVSRETCRRTIGSTSCRTRPRTRSSPGR